MEGISQLLCKRLQTQFMKPSANSIVVMILIGAFLAGCEKQPPVSSKINQEIDNPLKANVRDDEKSSPQKAARHFLPGTTITLKPRKDRYFLGENVLLDYRISYKGDGRLDLGTVTGLKPYSCQVIAMDEAGNRVPISTLEFHCTGHGGVEIGTGDSQTYTIPLMRYCRFEKPGVYRIRAAQDLGWSELDPGPETIPRIPDNDPRWAETTIVLIMPDASEARQVVEKMQQMRRDVESYRELCGFWETDDYADFVCLQYPLYLSILEELAVKGDMRALTGIAHIPTPEATQVLLGLLQHGNEAAIRLATAALCDRLPDPPGLKRPDRRNPIEVEDADPKLVKRSWRSSFSLPMRQFATKLLHEKEPTNLRCGAYILEAVGSKEDLPVLTDTVSNVVLIVEKTEPARHIGETTPIRQACMDLVYALESLAARGAEPANDPHTSGEIIFFTLAIKQRKDFRPVGWESRCAAWAQQATPFVQEQVLFNAPNPLPKPLVEPYQAGLQQVIATTRERGVIHCAVQSCLDIKMPTDEILSMLAARLSSEEVYHDIIMCLEDLLENGKHEHPFAECARFPGTERVEKAKAAWKRFLEKYGPAIRQGKHFSTHDPEIIEEMFF